MSSKMASKIFLEIKNAIKTRDMGTGLLTFNEVEQDQFDLIRQSLRHPTNYLEQYSFRIHWFAPERYLKVVIPCALHECPAEWVIAEISNALPSGAIPRVWARTIRISPSPEYKNFFPPFNRSAKEGDLTIVPLLAPDWTEKTKYPSVILESGWLEPADKLHLDARLWLAGSEGRVRVVMQVKFYKRERGERIGSRLWMSRVKPAVGSESSAETSPNTKQYEIFPPPDVAQENPSITFDEFFTGGCPPGINPQGCVVFNLENLRVIARGEILKRGAIPDE